jgi:hypothetical protein
MLRMDECLRAWIPARRSQQGEDLIQCAKVDRDATDVSAAAAA